MEDIFIDPRDGKSYNIIKLLDGKWWFAQNLNFTINGSRIALPALRSNFDQTTIKEDDPAYFYDSYLYGRLYDWEAARKACPPGWHIPTKKEWRYMLNKYGGFSSCTEDHSIINLMIRTLRNDNLIKLYPKIREYIKLKNDTNTRINPAGRLIAAQHLRYGGFAKFNAMRGGFFSNFNDENYSNFGQYQGTFWSADKDYFNTILSAYIYHIGIDGVYECTEISSWLFTVRCVKD